MTPFLQNCGQGRNRTRLLFSSSFPYFPQFPQIFPTIANPIVVAHPCYTSYIMIEGLTPVELYQTINRLYTQKMDIEAYTEARMLFARRSLWREKVMQNPFSEEANNILRDIASKHIREVRIAAVQEEPKKGFDFNFEKLEKQEQEEALYREIETSAEATMRLVQYANEHMNDLWDISDEDLFLQLKSIAFNTSDEAEVNEKFSRQQRRGFNFSIINSIHDRQIIRQYKEVVEANPKKEIGKILGITIEGSFSVECLPVGLIVYLSDEDWIKFDDILKNGEGPEQFDSSGAVLYFRKNLPSELRGKIALVHTGGQRTGERKKEDIANTRQHELRHILYRSFANTTAGYSLEALRIREAGSDIAKHQKSANQIIDSMEELAKNELLAYNVDKNQEFAPSLNSLGGEKWEQYLAEVDKETEGIIDMGKRAEVQRIYYDAYARYLREIRQYRWIFTQVMSSDEKAEALLYNVPVNKAKRLGHFLSIEPTDFVQNYHRQMSKISADLNSKVQKADRARHVRLFGRKLWETYSSTQWLAWSENVSFKESYELTLFYPEEAIPSYLTVLENSNNKYLVKHCLEALRYAALSAHTFSEGLHNRINASIDKLLHYKREKFEEVNTSAKEIQSFLNKVYAVRS